jgi:hypothetical protein
MDTTGDGEDRGRADAAAMSAGQQAAFGDGIVGGAGGGAREPGETDAAGDRDDDDLVAGGPIDVGEDAGGSRAGAGEVAADRARARDAQAAQEEAGLAPGESD